MVRPWLSSSKAKNGLDCMRAKYFIKDIRKNFGMQKTTVLAPADHLRVRNTVFQVFLSRGLEPKAFIKLQQI